MSSIVLWVSEINRQADFYSALLDAPVTSKSDEFCEVGDEKNSVLLHLLPEQYRSNGSSLAPAQGEVAIKPIFKVASINEAIARATAFDLRISGSATQYGDISFQDCIDPEGNVIQIAEG